MPRNIAYMYRIFFCLDSGLVFANNHSSSTVWGICKPKIGGDGTRFLCLELPFGLFFYPHLFLLSNLIIYFFC